MRIIILSSLLLINLLAMDIDKELGFVKDVYQLNPKNCSIDALDEKKIKLGKFFFEESFISGKVETSCATCHIDDKGSADGLPIAVGSGGKGLSSERYIDGKGALVQRNALSMIGRANKKFMSFFWDGKVEVQDDFIVSKFGEKISKKFDRPLSVAAIHPILERDELMGADSDMSDAIGNAKYQEKYKIISDVLRKRIFELKNEDSKQVAASLEELGINYENFELADIGNLIAVFMEDKFKCSESKFDKYLNGDKNALNEMEKKGALIFYGKGRCASCHSGELFSDFKYHSIGSPQGYFGPFPRHRDIGRAGVTNKAKDLFQFRTPPLIEVSKTAPYGHSGAFKDLKEIIVHHYNPVVFYKENDSYYEADKFMIGKFMGSRDDLLNAIDISNEDELVALLAFLMTI